jgi:4-carboxymuconolactone decarboxylase
MSLTATRRALLPMMALGAIFPIEMPLATGAPSSKTTPGVPMTSQTDIQNVSPALGAFVDNKLVGEVWKGRNLSPRDRSLITVSALIARNQTIDMPLEFKRALDNGVRPSELSETIFHLSFYAGWPNAHGAVEVAKGLLAERGIGPDQLPTVSPQLLPIDPEAERKRATRVQADVGPVSQGLVEYTGSVLFHDLWLRPDLEPRDRSLVTLSALIAAGQSAQMPFHLNKAMDNGLTRAQASEVLTHLAFYVGWPNAMSAVPVMKAVFDSRSPSPAQK